MSQSKGPGATSPAAFPEGRIALFYLVYFGALGVFLPYWSLYLRDEGHGAEAIGALMAIFVGSKIFGPPLLGWLADRTGRAMPWVRGFALLTVLAFLPVFQVDGFWAMALVMAVFSLFWNAIVPQFDAVTLRHLGARASEYSRLRSWGSLGFILAATALGVLVDDFGSGIVPVAALGLLLAIFALSLSVPDAGAPPSLSVPGSLWGLLCRPVVVAFLGASFLLNASHGSYYAFYTLHLTQFGYSKTVIGMLWSLGVLAEIGLFLVMARLLRAVSVYWLFMVTLGLTALRWLLIGHLADSLVGLLLAQLLHALSFGVAHSVAVDFIHRTFTGRLQGRGQALLSSLSYGLGGAVGLFGSGWVWQHYGPTASFDLAALLALLAVVLMAGRRAAFERRP